VGTVRIALSWVIDDWEARDPDPELESCGHGSEMGNANPQYKLQRRLLVSQYCERWEYKYKQKHKEVEMESGVGSSVDMFKNQGMHRLACFL